MFIIYIILQKAMKEKQVTGLFRELRSVRGSKAVRRSALELQMMNLTGTPDTAVQVGRKASWVATREYNSRPFDGTGVFFYS